MDDITILHLSDLHIDWDGATSKYPVALQNLLLDIEQQCCFFLENNVVVVVTGDLVHKGNFSAKNISAVTAFFKRLQEILGNKFCDILIVPGNHDKRYSEAHAKILDECYHLRYPLPTDYDELLLFGRYTQSDFFSLCKKIYDIFGVKHDDLISNTYGANLITVGSEHFCFICLNTALGCNTDQDYRRLRLGQQQLDSLSQQFRMIEEQEISLTFVLAHHPITWLVGEEEDALQNKLLSASGWNASFYLCGHVHNRDATGFRNNHHSLTTLMTGMGWPDSERAHSDPHAYSIYIFNLDFNSVDIYMRSASVSGLFAPDYNFFSANDISTGLEKSVYPIEINKNQAFFTLGRYQGRSPKTYFFSDKFIVDVRQMYMQIAMFQIAISKELINILYDVGDIILDKKFSTVKSDNSSLNDIVSIMDFDSNWKEYCSNDLLSPEKVDEITSEIEELLFDDKASIFEAFDSYIQAICYRMGKLLESNAKCDSENVIRIHARYLAYTDQEDKEFSHRGLCVSYGKKALTSERIHSIPWNNQSLIKAAFETKKPLIFRMNKDVSLRCNEKWHNFLTFVPDNFGNIVSKNNKCYPVISFGVSCTGPEFDHILYLLDFFQIDKIVGNVIKQFTDKLSFPMEEYIKYKHVEENDYEHKS